MLFDRVAVGHMKLVSIGHVASATDELNFSCKCIEINWILNLPCVASGSFIGEHWVRILWVFPSPLSLLKGPSLPVHVDERDYPMVVVGNSDTCHYWIWILWGQKLSLFYGSIPKVPSSGPDMRNVCWAEAGTAQMKGNVSPWGDDLSSLREAL